MYIDKLDDIVNKYNNTYHRTIKMKSVGVKPSMYTEFNKENDKVGYHVRISKYKNIFAIVYVPNSPVIFVIKKT